MEDQVFLCIRSPFMEDVRCQMSVRTLERFARRDGEYDYGLLLRELDTDHYRTFARAVASGDGFDIGPDALRDGFERIAAALFGLVGEASVALTGSLNSAPLSVGFIFVPRKVWIDEGSRSHHLMCLSHELTLTLGDKGPNPILFLAPEVDEE